MNILTAITQRKSCRTYKQVPLTPDNKNNVEEYIRKSSPLFGKTLNFKLVEKIDSKQLMKLNYGGISGHNTYLLAAAKPTAADRILYGYQAENIVLKATALGLASCWVGFFDNAYFDFLEIENGYEIPSIVILGYPAKKPSIADTFSRITVRAAKRLPTDKLFFNYATQKPLSQQLLSKYSEVFEMVRLAPSGKNLQPWRIFFDQMKGEKSKGEFHFYKNIASKNFEQMGIHDIDMGIAMSHFESAATSLELTGDWNKKDSAAMRRIEPYHYCLSWKIR